MSKSNIQLEKQIDSMTQAQIQANLTIKTLGAENTELVTLLDQSHIERGKMQREFKKASAYIG